MKGLESELASTGFQIWSSTDYERQFHSDDDLGVSVCFWSPAPVRVLAFVRHLRCGTFLDCLFHTRCLRHRLCPGIRNRYRRYHPSLSSDNRLESFIAVGPKKRLLAGIVIKYFFAIGQLFLVAFAYFIRTWRTLTWAIGLFTIPFVGFYLYVLTREVKASNC